MLDSIHHHKPIQLVLGFLMGILFGFFLQKGGVTDYDVLVGQLLLTDFTVIKVILSAVLTGMVGIYFMERRGWVTLHIKKGSVGSSALGGLIFGVGFALLGYCPGTVVGAAGQGYLDAFLAGIPGLLLGTGLYAAIYPGLNRTILHKGDFGKKTIPQLLHLNPWFVIATFSIVVIGFLWFME